MSWIIKADAKVIRTEEDELKVGDRVVVVDKDRDDYIHGMNYQKQMDMENNDFMGEVVEILDDPPVRIKVRFGARGDAWSFSLGEIVQ